MVYWLGNRAVEDDRGVESFGAVPLVFPASVSLVPFLMPTY